MTEEILGYKLVPITEDNFKGMQPASSSSCFLSRVCISGCGGYKELISERAFDKLMTNRKLLKEVQKLIRNEVFKND